MDKGLLLGLAMTCLLGYAATTPAAESAQNTRFYLAPMASYGFFDEQTFEPDENIGAQLSLGKTLTEHLALELYAHHFSGIDLDSTPNGEMDVTGYGLSALFFPARDILPLFAIVGVGEGEHQFENGNPSLDDQDADFVDLGLGFLVPLNDYGVALRGEYRYRSSDVEAPNTSAEHQFHDNLISLGLQIPLGAGDTQPDPEPVTPMPEPIPADPLDSDDDGVPDPKDECPGTPPRTEVTTDGCPTEKREPIVLEGVWFEFDSAKLTQDAEQRLDNVVNALQGSPKLEVRIAGHTDNIGNASYNLDLSQRRADSVKAYLVRHGIEPSRLTARGFGETRPVAPNSNPESRAENRRVELNVVRQ